MKTVVWLLVPLSLLATIAEAGGGATKTPVATKAAAKKPPFDPRLRAVAESTEQIQSKGSTPCDDSTDDCEVTVVAYSPGKVPDLNPPNSICAAVVMGSEVHIGKGVSDKPNRHRTLTWKIVKADQNDPEDYHFEVFGVDLAFDSDPKTHGDDRDLKGGHRSHQKQWFTYFIINSRVRSDDYCAQGLCAIKYGVRVRNSQGPCETYDPKISNDGL